MPGFSGIFSGFWAFSWLHVDHFWHFVFNMRRLFGEMVGIIGHNWASSEHERLTLGS
jgi:hypothetical protein